MIPPSLSAIPRSRLAVGGVDTARDDAQVSAPHPRVAARLSRYSRARMTSLRILAPPGWRQPSGPARGVSRYCLLAGPLLTLRRADERRRRGGAPTPAQRAQPQGGAVSRAQEHPRARSPRLI